MAEAELLVDDVLDALVAWLPGRRWFHARDAGARLTVVDRLELADPAGEARVVVLLLGVGLDPDPPFMQVPLVFRAPGTAPAGTAPLASVPGARLEVFDGPDDPAFVRAWLAAADDGGRLGAVLDADSARPVSGEQSNSSIIVAGTDGGPGAILKVFRSVWPGKNPDVDVPDALARSGWPHVPAPLAWLEHAGTEPIQLGVLSRFVPGAQDGFELACAMAARGESFAPLADALGVVIAELHERLATALPVTPPHRIAAAELTVHLHDRLEWSVAGVPELARWRGAVGALVDRLGELDELPWLQRVHGDLHLGQLLRTADAWFVLDFEGEPMVPLAARSLPGLALRDVAGILRSFDYAAARAEADASWTAEARAAFLGAYRREVPAAASREAALVLRAFEVDKALYEVVYETQNRPHWAAIPWQALRRLVGSPQDGPGGGRVGT